MNRRTITILALATALGIFLKVTQNRPVEGKRTSPAPRTAQLPTKLVFSPSRSNPPLAQGLEAPARRQRLRTRSANPTSIQRLENESLRVSRLSVNPSGDARRIHEIAERLKSADLEMLSKRITDPSVSAEERFLAAYLIAMSKNEASYRALENALLSISIRPPKAHEEDIDGEALAIFLVDSLAKKSPERIGDVLSKASRSENLKPISSYLAQLEKASQRGRVVQFYRAQERVIRKIARSQ